MNKSPYSKPSDNKSPKSKPDPKPADPKPKPEEAKTEPKPNPNPKSADPKPDAPSNSSKKEDKSTVTDTKPKKDVPESKTDAKPDWRKQLAERKKVADAKIGTSGGNSHRDYAWKISSKLHERIQMAQSHDFVSQTILGAMQKPRPKAKPKPFKSATSADLAYHREIQERGKTSGMNLAMFVKNAPNLKSGGVALPGLVGGRGQAGLRRGRGGRGRGFKLPSAHRGTVSSPPGRGRVALPGMVPK